MTVIILAAGKGKRMKAAGPKVLQPLLGRPMISRIMSAVLRFSPEEIIVVVSPEGHQPIREILGNEGIDYVIQPEANGTADAVKRCKDYVHTRRAMILCGDVPLISATTISDMIAIHQSRGASATLLSTEVPDPAGYGRIIRNGDGSVQRIIEHKDANSQQRSIREINSGTYIFESQILFQALEDIQPSPVTGEFYLTDVVAKFVEGNLKVEALKIDDRNEIMGVNDFIALKKVEDIYRERLLEKWRKAGAHIEHPHMIEADSDVELASGAKVVGRSTLRGYTSIGPASLIGPFVYLEDTVVEGNSFVKGERSKKS